MDSHILVSTVIREVEVASNCFFWVANIYIPKVVDKSILDSEESLAHILHATYFACNTINEVGAPTGHIPHTAVLEKCTCGGNQSRFIQEGAVSAIVLVAEVKPPLL